MTDRAEQEEAEARSDAYVEQCKIALGIILGGEKVWETIPPQYIKAENIGGVIEAGLKNSMYLEQSTIANGKGVVHGFIERMAGEMEAWARRTGRVDLLIPMRTKLDQAMLETRDRDDA